MNTHTQPRPSFTCPTCKHITSHPVDVANKYCPACLSFAGRRSHVRRFSDRFLMPPQLVVSAWQALVKTSIAVLVGIIVLVGILGFGLAILVRTLVP